MLDSRTKFRKRRPAGLYAPASLEAVRRIARACGFGDDAPRLIIAYLALVSSTSLKNEDGNGPNRVTGAGAKYIRKTLGLVHEKAKECLHHLERIGVIGPAPKGVRAGRMRQARYVMTLSGDVNIPFDLTKPEQSALKEAGDGRTMLTEVGSVLRRRILNSGFPAQVQTMALLLLVHCYGLPPMTIPVRESQSGRLGQPVG